MKFNIFNKNLIRSLIAVFITAIASMPAIAQVDTTAESASQDEDEPNVIERIMEESNGNVNFYIEDDLIEKILSAPKGHKKSGGQSTQRIRPGINKMSGYRIQVFADGRNQHSLESRAKARGNAISAKLPKYRGQIYTFSSSPNWYTRVGNFRTQAEANAALAELRANFPNFANEMRVVKCQIVVIK